MPKSNKPKPDKPTVAKQINFRADAALTDRLEKVAEAFGLDVSNLVRLILNQNLATYEQQAERMKQGKPPTTE